MRTLTTATADYQTTPSVLRIFWLLCGVLFAATEICNSVGAACLASETVFQPVASYPVDLDGESSFRFANDLGGDMRRIGPGAARIPWMNGKVVVSAGNQFCGMLHSLAGKESESKSMNLNRCLPKHIRSEFQASVTGIRTRLRGKGTFKLEIKALNDSLIWQRVFEFDNPGSFQNFLFAIPPKVVRQATDAKLVTWIAEPANTVIEVDRVSLQLEYPKLSWPEKAFLISYCQLLRTWEPDLGICRDRENFSDILNVPSTGLFAASTFAALDMGLVNSSFAMDVLRKIRRTFRVMPRSEGGLMPHFVIAADGKFIPISEFSSVDSALAILGFLFGAVSSGDVALKSFAEKQFRRINFARLYNADLHVIHGFEQDGVTPLASVWAEATGETILVLMAETISQSLRGRAPMAQVDPSIGLCGHGFAHEIHGLFFSEFDSSVKDNVFGINWRADSRQILRDNLDFFTAHFPNSRLAQLGLFGLSATEGSRGIGYSANGVYCPLDPLAAPHYMVMSASRRGDVYRLNRIYTEMHQRQLLPPWGFPEHVRLNLEYLPMHGSLNANFCCIQSYHNITLLREQPDILFDAVRASDLLSIAVYRFYSD